MTRKTRRNPKQPAAEKRSATTKQPATKKTPQPAAEQHPAAKKPSAAKRPSAAKKPSAAKRPSAAKKPSAAEKQPAARKFTLPAFGLAEDVLAKPAAPEAPADAPSPAKAGDPSRIFTFADTLEQGTAEAETESAPVRLETWVAFSLAGEVFALPVEPVREVVRVTSLTRVPHAPQPIRGVTNMRGRVIPVIDLRLRIELPPKELDRASRVIVVRSRGRQLGLLVDAVHQVIHIDLNQVQPPPEDVMTVQSDYLSGVYHLDDQLILLLDIDRALIIRDVVAPAGPGDDAPGEAAAGSV